jgi:hypothetical protein
MEPNHSPNLPSWLIPAGIVAVFGCLAAVYFLFPSSPQPPPALVISDCRTIAPGMRRIGTESSTQFDVTSDTVFAIHAGLSDMPGNGYDATVKYGGASMAISSEDYVFSNLKSNFPHSSENLIERVVRDRKGRLIGEDRWGYLETGERWRFVRFSWGEAMGYRPARREVASFFDKIIDSACFLPGSPR